MKFRELLARNQAYLSPAVFNPLSAKLAEQAGFQLLYLSGGALGYIKCCLEANLSLPDVIQTGIEMRAVCDLPLIMDGICGWGDPMHVGFTVKMAETAGFCAIEIEDQLLPKRAHHHAGIEHMIPRELMAAKVREAVRARKNLEFVIIARTNGVRSSNIDDALRRSEAYREAGADMLFIIPRTPEEARFIATRLPPPLMFSLQSDDVKSFGMTLDELGQLGYRVLTVNRVLTVTTPALAFHRAMQQTYHALAGGQPNPVLAGTTRKAEQAALHDTLGLEALLEIERATVER
jgi:2-methylisocitrate lyase-like PEP mutase family enzyme